MHIPGELSHQTGDVVTERNTDIVEERREDVVTERNADIVEERREDVVTERNVEIAEERIHQYLDTVKYVVVVFSNALT